MVDLDRAALGRAALAMLILSFVGDMFLSKSPPPRRVIVIGGGLAGLSATIAAVDAGAHVVLLEKTDRLGGNSAKATSGINGWGTEAQLQAGIRNDSAEVFAQDTLRSAAGGTSHESLVRILTEGSTDAVDWLTRLGVPLTTLSQLGGHSRKRTHRAPDKPDGTPTPIGFTIMSTLERHIREHLTDHVTVTTAAKVESFLQQGDHVTGVRVRVGDSVEEMYADAVVLCTGGFSNDHTDTSLLQQYAPHLVSTPTTNGPFATGDGVKMARAIGVKLVDMDKIQLHPTGLINPKAPAAATKFLGPETLRGSGGILLNAAGARFVDELERRSVVTAAILEQGTVFPNSDGCRVAYCVLNADAVALFGRGALEFYWKRIGVFQKAETVADLATIIGATESAVQETLAQYEVIARNGQTCPITGKSVFPAVISPDGPFFVAVVTPAIHYTMGGCEMNEQSALLDDITGHPIPGLFGAGEVTGGLHGANRLGGNSLLECVVFGRNAGAHAAIAS